MNQVEFNVLMQGIGIVLFGGISLWCLSKGMVKAGLFAFGLALAAAFLLH